MKMAFLLFAALLCILRLSAQTTIDATITHDSLVREYRLYVPASYSAATPAPLVFNLHGYGSDNMEQEFYGDFRPIADTAGFLIVHPNGTFDASSKRFWNSGFGSSIDDVGFLEALIDSLSADYNINPLRIYTTGMSNGGFMSYHLACNSDRFAAIASVTGSMSTLTFATCAPAFNIPVMEVHGTSDPIVPYTGGSGVKAIADVLDYWATFNSCPTPPTITAVPDVVPSDGATAEHHVYAPGTLGVTMEHYKVIGGAHTWPGASIIIGTTCMDFSASVEIWRFFSQYTMVTGRTKPVEVTTSLKLSPVPAHEELFAEAGNLFLRSVTVYDMTGKAVLVQDCTQGKARIDLSAFSPGVYILRATDGENWYASRFTKE